MYTPVLYMQKVYQAYAFLGAACHGIPSATKVDYANMLPISPKGQLCSLFVTTSAGKNYIPGRCVLKAYPNIQ
jgi:hypothetical protein